MYQTNRCALTKHFPGERTKRISMCRNKEGVLHFKGRPRNSCACVPFSYFVFNKRRVFVVRLSTDSTNRRWYASASSIELWGRVWIDVRVKYRPGIVPLLSIYFIAVIVDARQGSSSFMDNQKIMPPTSVRIDSLQPARLLYRVCVL